MKTMKRFAARICALFVVLTVSLTALVPAAFAATKAQLPDLPSLPSSARVHRSAY